MKTKIGLTPEQIEVGKTVYYYDPNSHKCKEAKIIYIYNDNLHNTYCDLIIDTHIENASINYLSYEKY